MLSFSLVRSSVVFAFSVALLASSSASAEGRHGSRAPDVRGADVVLTAPGLSAREARDYRGAVLVERGALRDDIRRLDAQIDALSAISLRAHPPLRDALCHQISALKADVSQLRRRLRDAQPVDVRIESRRARTPRWESRPDRARPQPASPTEFASIKRGITSTPYSNERLQLLRSIVVQHHLTTAQARELAALFAFSSERVDALVALYPRVIDPQNYHETYELLVFSNDRKTLMQRIGVI